MHATVYCQSKTFYYAIPLMNMLKKEADRINAMIVISLAVSRGGLFNGTIATTLGTKAVQIN
jgi:hypothetical protein